MQSDLNIITLPFYLIVKSVFQLTLIALSFTLKRSYSLIHSVVYCVILLALMIVIYVTRPHNYMRFNLWTMAVICGNVWLAFLSSIENYAENTSSIALYIFLFIGWVAIAICAFAL